MAPRTSTIQLSDYRRRKHPQTFTAAEQVIEELSNRIYASGETYGEIAAACGVSRSTVYMIASRNTKWPRPKTFFPLLAYFGLRLVLEAK